MFPISSFVLEKIQVTFMSNYYLDEIEKIKYYRERITEDLLRRGTAANSEQVSKQLDTIDTKLALFSQAYIRSGETFDTDKFNKQKKTIYEDLMVLYKVLYTLANDRFEKARARMRYELDDLRLKAKEYRYLVDAQTVSVYGNTIFQQANNFDQEYQNGQVVISLGPITVPSGSYLAPMIASDEFDPKDVTFIFIDSDGNELRSSAYNYNKNYIKIAGNYQLHTFSYDSNDKAFGKELISIDRTLYDTDQYNIFLNKDKIRVRNLDLDSISYAEKRTNLYYKAAGQETDSFYVYGASFIQLSVVGKIDFKNITDDELLMPAQRQKIVLRGSDFSFDIKTDGTIYADKTEALISGDQLSIANDYDNITDYMVEDIAYGDDVTFSDVKVIIDNADSTFFDIQYIIIKQAQISELEDRE